MKKLFVIVAMLAFFSSSAQTRKKPAPKKKVVTTTKKISFASTNTGITYKQPDTDSFYLIIMSGKTDLIKYKTNGDLFFNPKEFCLCDSCQKFVGMKLWGNIFKKNEK